MRALVVAAAFGSVALTAGRCYAAPVIKSLTCSADRREAAGGYVEVKLTRNSQGRYDGYRTVTGLAANDAVRPVLMLIEDIECTFAGEDARLVTCSSQETRFSTKLVIETEADQQGGMTIRTFIDVSSASEQPESALTERFQINPVDRAAPAGCRFEM